MTGKITASAFGPPEDDPPEGLRVGGWEGPSYVYMQSKDETPQEVELSSAPDLEQRYRLAAQAFDLNPEVVYHPCSGSNITPSIVFPNARVIYAEIHQPTVDALQESGHEVHGSATEFTPDAPVDLLILLNPSISAEVPARSVRSGGYVFCNNYHQTAEELQASDGFKLVGVVVSTAEGFQVDRDDLDAYFQEVATEEEWRNSRPGFSLDVMRFEAAQAAVQALVPDAPDVLTGYGRLLEQARIQYRSTMLKLLGGEIACGLIADPSTQSVFDVKGHTILTQLPMKKGGADDIFVFRKK